MRWQLPWFAVLVRGPSMAPTLRSGDALLVRRGGRIRAGDVVVARFRSRPDLLVVKRAVREEDGRAVDELEGIVRKEIAAAGSIPGP